MTVNYEKRFLKELAQIPSSYRHEIEEYIFKKAPKLDSIADTGKIEKMPGYPGFYKIRFGPYRVGLKSENNQIIFQRVLHRREIYRFFP